MRRPTDTRFATPPCEPETVTGRALARMQEADEAEPEEDGEEHDVVDVTDELTPDLYRALIAELRETKPRRHSIA